MRLGCMLAGGMAALAALGTTAVGQSAAGSRANGDRTYVGFDKNGYPGDNWLPRLRKMFAYTGFWLNDPPGMKTNPWAGKRSTVRAEGFGFLLLFNGRLDRELKGGNAEELGREDAAAAIAAAKRAGFPPGAVIFLDQEEGGALLAEQAAYLGAWIADADKSAYKAGVYCSGIAVAAGSKTISTAADVATRFPEAKLWVWNDACPPSPGCVSGEPGFDPAGSGFSQALVWQYARSPRSADGTAACRQTYAADNGCYAPGLPQSPATFVDLNVSRLSDPSRGR